MVVLCSLKHQSKASHVRAAAQYRKIVKNIFLHPHPSPSLIFCPVMALNLKTSQYFKIFSKVSTIFWQRFNAGVFHYGWEAEAEITGLNTLLIPASMSSYTAGSHNRKGFAQVVTMHVTMQSWDHGCLSPVASSDHYTVPHEVQDPTPEVKTSVITAFFCPGKKAYYTHKNLQILGSEGHKFPV